MGNCLTCFSKKQSMPDLPIHHHKESAKNIEIKKPIDILYSLTISIWNAEIIGLYDLRLNFHSKTQDYDNKLWIIMNYIVMKCMNKKISPLTALNQSMIFVNIYQLQCLKHELEKLEDIKILWKDFAKKEFYFK